MAARLHALRYYGGKHQQAPWIAGRLPWDFNTLYAEPFGGMASVLLARPPVKLEIVNDVNSRLINWWRCVRDHPEEMSWLVETIPHSREDFEWCMAHLDDPELSPVRRALAFHTVVGGSIVSTDIARPGDFRMGYRSEARTGSRPHIGARWPSGRVSALAERLSCVQLDHRDGLDLLARLAKVERAVVYVDPPYATAHTKPYVHEEVDRERLAALLRAQAGFAAVSGYGAEWDHLGWTRHERAARRVQINCPSEPRVEVLWTNREATPCR